jgi:predicted transcriptional regulator
MQFTADFLFVVGWKGTEHIVGSKSIPLGTSLRLLRLLSGHQAKDIARSAGVSASLVSLIEAGKRSPDAQLVQLILRAIVTPTEGE